jgi:long-chain acyl-CoA synthetase
VVLFALPMHHAFGLVVILFTSIYKGSTVLMLNGVSIPSLMELIKKEKATMFMGVPFIHALMVNLAEEEGAKYDLSSLRLCGSAGAALPADIAQKFKEHFGLGLVDFWGMTEASAHVTCCSLNGKAISGSVGKALPGWELKIVDEMGRELPPNQPGEIVVRGPLMSEYYHHPQLTTTVLRQGWLYTGDLGMVDDQGNLFLTGNKKGMIIAKGQNIYPGDIEEVLYLHPKVAEAAVIGMPDEVRGQTIRAVIQLKAGEVASEQEMRRFCLEHLANYKAPKQVIFINSLPKTATGEIRKEDLRRL